MGRHSDIDLDLGRYEVTLQAAFTVCDSLRLRPDTNVVNGNLVGSCCRLVRPGGQSLPMANDKPQPAYKP